jgi:hypothetical protein
MNIIEVMNLLQIEVGYARRPSWGDGEILVRENVDDIDIININEKKYPNHENIYFFGRDDLLADDWIVVDGKE